MVSKDLTIYLVCSKYGHIFVTVCLLLKSDREFPVREEQPTAPEKLYLITNLL